MIRCFQILLICGLCSCAEQGGISMNSTTSGALAGGALGAGMGAIVGSQSGHAGPGVAIGAAAGTLGGALIGHSFDSTRQEQEQLAGRIAQNQQQIDENRRLLDELRGRGVDVSVSKRGVVVNLPDVLFEFGSWKLTGKAQQVIEEIAGVLTSNAVERTLAVEGHTDAIGTVTYNKKLSLQRAGAVADALAKNGIARNQMRVDGFGEGNPVATNSTDVGRARNRRVEVIIEN